MYTWVFDTWFLGRPGIPGGSQKPFQKVGGEAPYLLEWFLGSAGAAQSLKIDDFQRAPKNMYKKPKCKLNHGFGADSLTVQQTCEPSLASLNIGLAHRPKLQTPSLCYAADNIMV